VEYCAFFNKNKHQEYDFLSNFYEHPVVLPYGAFACSEGLYQFQKFAHLSAPEIKNAFIHANGEQACLLSRKLAERIDPKWDRVKAMKKTLRYKFKDPQLKKMLLETGDAYLVENSPKGHDSFWSDNGDGTGENRLGICLMELRKELGGKGIVAIPKILNHFYKQKCEICNNPCHFTNRGMVYNFCDQHMGEKLELGNVSARIRPSQIPDGTGRFLYFNINDMPEFVEEGARMIVERIKELNLKNPYFVTPETSTISIAHVLRTKYNIDGTIISKRKKLNNIDTLFQEYCAITSLDKKTLYLEKSIDLSNKDIVIIDNVCTTGETLKAVFQLLCKAGVDSDRIKEAIVLFTEGVEHEEIKLSQDKILPIHKFAHIPILPNDPSIDNTLYKFYSECDLPTMYGSIKFCIFKHRTLDIDAIVCVSPLTFINDNRMHIPVRVHDACMTSETFHSIKCDCQLQLAKAMEYISEYGGMVIYLNQEGRGIGLGNKIAAYDLQERYMLDTVDANRELGMPDDMREYVPVRDILNHFGVESVLLMTNNRRKVNCLREIGVQVDGTIPCIVKPQSHQMRKYMKDKVERMGHIIPLDYLKPGW